MGNWLESNMDAEARAAAALRKRNLWLATSTIAHAALLFALCWPPGAMFVKPRLLANGQGGTAAPASITLYLSQDLALAAPHHPSLLSLPTQAKAGKTRLQKRNNVLERERPGGDVEAGSRLGTSFDGPAEGEEIKQGFAIVFAPPHVSRWELPDGREADVVVELSIDAQGNVVKEKLLQGVGPDIDQRVLAAVRDWHFRPATRNGVAIPFKYDARFHFPS